MTDYAMYSPEGNREVEKLLNQVKSRAMRGAMARGNVLPFMSAGMQRIEKTHPEVYDTSVREAIFSDLDELFDKLYWARYDGDEFYEV